MGVAISVSPGATQPGTNQYAITGTLSLTNAVAGTATFTDGATSTTVAVSAGATSVPYSLSGLSSGTGSHTVTVSYAGQTASATYTAPASTTVGTPTLQLEKFVSQSTAQIGDILTYSLVLTNTSTVSATNVTVRDSFSQGATYVANSATVPSGTTFTPGTSSTLVSTWQIASLSGGQSLTLTFSVRADNSGIIYNTATIPGDTASVCTTVPFQVCKGSDYAFLLSVVDGLSSYQWYLNGQPITGAISNTVIATQAGSYSVAVGGVGSASACESGSCCPFIIEELAEVPVYALAATSPTCTGTAVQQNGSVTLTGLASSTATSYTYQIAKGSTFTSGTLVTPGQLPVPSGGVLSSTLEAGVYTVRVYTPAGCFRDQTVEVLLVPCQCPPAKCVPFVIQKVSRTGTGGAPVGGGGGR